MGPKKQQEISTMRRLFGFELADFQSWSNFVKLMNRPEDPSSLAALRILFGILMMLDIPQERGMSHADVYYPNEDKECQFPLFNFLEPLRAEYMVVVYFIMFLSAIGITLGLFYRLVTICFTITYWYVFFLDKTSWNNHSYLYGLIGFQLMFSDAHHYWSIDGLFRKKIRNSHVPLWNYTLIRYQVFLVYFIAGLKKTEWDWVAGYSMDSLGDHWVFSPFRSFLTIEQITLIIVHVCGLFFDLLVGFALFFDRSRPIGIFFSVTFHLMNSQMFSIGMFPYTMLATIPIFFHNDWLRKFLNRFVPKFLYKVEPVQYSSSCLYSKEEIKPEESKTQSLKSAIANANSIKNAPTKPTFRHKIFTIFALLYLTEQAFLPYSHFITKGYNNWTNGLYGYSWDMMIHSWHTQHVKITFIDKTTQEPHYLRPTAWASAKRWSSHADMIVQYAQCIKGKLKEHGYDDVELRFDIWRSMNGRFNQRQIDPRIDLLSSDVKWSPFKETPWLQPLLTNLSDWRTRMLQIENDLSSKDQNVLVTFVADFPGLFLENYIPPDLNTTIEVLEGEVIVELISLKKNITLNVGQNLTVPNGDYHNVYTVSSTPSCYMYVYLNQSDADIVHLWDRFYNLTDRLLNETVDYNRPLHSDKEEADLVRLSYEDVFEKLRNKTLHELLELPNDYKIHNKNESNINWTNIRLQFETSMNRSMVKRLDTKVKWHERNLRIFKSFMNRKKKQFLRCYQIVKLAFKSIFYQTDFFQLVDNEIRNVDEESTTNAIITEESPPQTSSKSSSSSKKTSSSAKTKKKNTKK
ncbi:unnamed protein product [Rotaria sordida]|uniref:Vitamin K-dependent gamma-carboxylase n=2 Tax=Rotaria sordida TaxID=392033 RepID=A0A814S582_9BILA|nr:unnamed protein product [Rotaria sordida]CAF1157446.1 unnamed protein product [Rotaria sordida]CAF3617781.1 unnamed protein product [Rotaria sordida]CAF3741384.1 unnamed protein product [Rotaria sordida]